MPLRTSLFAAALAAFSTTLAAQTPPDIAFERYTLANGLQVILHRDGKMPAVNVNLWYHVGSKNETPGRTGFAHLFEHMMFQGSKNVKGEYLQLAEQAGANLQTGGVNGTTNEDRTNYFETVPSGSLEYALWLEADRMGFLGDALTQEKLSNQQDVVKNEKRQGDNAPYAVAQYLVAEHLYPAGHPYAHTVIGSLDDLTAATLGDVRAFFARWYTPNNCTLTLSGDFDAAEARRLVQKYFGPIPAGEPLSRPGVNIPQLPRTKRVHATDRVPQGRLYLVYPAPQRFSAEEAPLQYIASMLADGKNSRLYTALVKESGLASDVSVYYDAREISGEFVVVATARPGSSLDDVRDAIDREFARFAGEGASDDELARRKVKSEAGFLGSLERIGGFGGVADRLGEYNTYLGDPGYFLKDFERFQRVDRAGISAAFAAWIAGARRLEVYIAPETAGRPDAAEFDRGTPPAATDPAAFSVPAVERATLPNGLELFVARRADLPRVSFTLATRVGRLLEPAATAGESALTAAVMDEGTATRSGADILDELDRLGSSLGCGGGAEGSSVSGGCLKRNLDATFTILADIVLHPAFGATEVAREKKLMADRILQQKSEPWSIGFEVFQKLLFGTDHPLGRPATTESVAAITPELLQRNHRAYWRPNNAVLVFTGDITLAEATGIATRHLAGWESADLATQDIPAAAAPAGHTVYLVDKKDAPQSVIIMGSTAPDRYSRDYLPITVMNAVLGGGFSTRLNLNLREDKGYTYGAFSSFSMRRRYGFWAASSGVQAKVTKEALAEFRSEVAGMSGARPVTSGELAGRQNNLTRGYVQNFESIEMLRDRIAPLAVLGIPVEILNDYVPGVKAATPAGVMATARTYLDFGRAITVVVGDLAVIEQPVRSLGWGKVVVVDADGKALR